MKTLQILIFLILSTYTLFAQEGNNFPSQLAADKIEVDGNLFKLKIYGAEQVGFKIRISKQIDGRWQLVNRRITDLTYHNYELIDWNQDGYTDIRVSASAMYQEVTGQEEYVYSLLVYDKENASYVFISDYTDVAGSYTADYNLTANNDYYYSYQVNGCDGNLASSNLFIMEGFEIIELGKITICSGNCCNGAQGIVEAYQIVDGKEMQVNVSTQQSQLSYAEYWEQYYKEYIRD